MPCTVFIAVHGIFYARISGMKQKNGKEIRKFLT